MPRKRYPTRKEREEMYLQVMAVVMFIICGILAVYYLLGG